MNYFIATIESWKAAWNQRWNGYSTAPTYKKGKSQDICRSNPTHKLRRDVWLWRLSNTDIHVFGFPDKLEDIPPGLTFLPWYLDNTKLPVLHLRASVPAYVTYIVGSDWHAKLQPNTNLDGRRIFRSGEIIPRPDTCSATDERQTCLRMIRCGAIAIGTEDGVALRGEGWSEVTALFGWPAEGGVWILRMGPGGYDDLNSSRSIGTYPDDSAEEVAKGHGFDQATQKLKHEEDMEGICRIIESANGQFYSRVERLSRGGATGAVRTAYWVFAMHLRALRYHIEEPTSRRQKWSPQSPMSFGRTVRSLVGRGV